MNNDVQEEMGFMSQFQPAFEKKAVFCWRLAALNLAPFQGSQVLMDGSGTKLNLGNANFSQ